MNEITRCSFIGSYVTFNSVVLLLRNRFASSNCSGFNLFYNLEQILNGIHVTFPIPKVSTLKFIPEAPSYLSLLMIGISRFEIHKIEVKLTSNKSNAAMHGPDWAAIASLNSIFYVLLIDFFTIDKLKNNQIWILLFHQLCFN